MKDTSPNVWIIIISFILLILSIFVIILIIHVKKKANNVSLKFDIPKNSTLDFKFPYQWPSGTSGLWKNFNTKEYPSKPLVLNDSSLSKLTIFNMPDNSSTKLNISNLKDNTIYYVRISWNIEESVDRTGTFFTEQFYIEFDLSYNSESIGSTTLPYYQGTKNTFIMDGTFKKASNSGNQLILQMNPSISDGFINRLTMANQNKIQLNSMDEMIIEIQSYPFPPTPSVSIPTQTLNYELDKKNIQFPFPYTKWPIGSSALWLNIPTKQTLTSINSNTEISIYNSTSLLNTEIDISKLNDNIIYYYRINGSIIDISSNETFIGTIQFFIYYGPMLIGNVTMKYDTNNSNEYNIQGSFITNLKQYNTLILSMSPLPNTMFVNRLQNANSNPKTIQLSPGSLSITFSTLPTIIDTIQYTLNADKLQYTKPYQWKSGMTPLWMNVPVYPQYDIIQSTNGVSNKPLYIYNTFSPYSTSIDISNLSNNTIYTFEISGSIQDISSDMDEHFDINYNVYYGNNNVSIPITYTYNTNNINSFILVGVFQTDLNTSTTLSIVMSPQNASDFINRINKIGKNDYINPGTFRIKFTSI